MEKDPGACAKSTIIIIEGIVYYKGGTIMKNGINAKIEALWNKGYSISDIAWMLDISISEVSEWVNYWMKKNRML